MNLEEYQQKQQRISRSLIAFILRLLNPFKDKRLTQADWDSVLGSMFTEVERKRSESAELGRAFFDSQRAEHLSGERHDVDLAPYAFDWFAEAMKPVKEKLLQPDTDDSSLSNAALHAVKEVENGGRRTLLRAVETDRRSPMWARVPYKETCSFCLMCISRGPVYQSAETAGLNTDDTTAAQLIGAGDDAALAKLMRRFHPGCDCKVVPVYNRRSWPGRAAHKQAQKLWNEETKGYSGKDALNAFRRAVYAGKIDESVLSAA